ncbi:amino acid transporter [Rhizodiscina lignyota]|uniref:Amino acid transporter n=1 Tax=Rhizodiscina lignyota TaxID=1504668 RepID=A0A9P4M2X0_9PEZI|nr:amino acid transporter [Rhizodiscina lignyota]
MSKDEHRLAQLGYKQVFIRSFGMFENWAATFTTMNFVSGMPVLFGFAMYTGGPQAAFANWTMVGGFSFIVSLAMAEIAASLPTAGGIYYWSYVLGGHNYGPLLSWLTAWFNWAGWLTIIPGLAQGNTNFMLSLLTILYPNATVIQQGWFGWVISTINILLGVIPNCVNQHTVRWMLRATAYSTALLMSFYWICYCWIIGVLFGAWEFYGYDASVHLSEETHQASSVVARGMWTGTIATWLGSIPTLILVLLCMQNFMGIVNGEFPNNWAEYLVQLVGNKGAVAILIFTWLDGILCTGVCLLSAQRITFAIARDGILPFSRVWSKVTKKHHLPVNACFLIAFLSIAICAAVIGSYVAFSAITAAATVGTNLSYLFPIVARQTLGRSTFQPAKWNLGRWSIPVSVIASGYIMFLFVVLMLPQLYPVNAQTLNYCPVVIGGITVIALGGWFFPFGLGGRYWFTGPKRTISEAEVLQARVKEDDKS